MARGLSGTPIIEVLIEAAIVILVVLLILALVVGGADGPPRSDHNEREA